jgi:PhzF family phenazine biosynthesis protein
MKTYFVDTFTSEPFKGNPAGVCFLDEEISPKKMQAIAKEIGFSETAFVKKEVGSNTYQIRYFSPKKEIPLCGHATLASAKVIFANTEANSLLFITGEQLELQISRENEKIVMAFPVYDTTPVEVPGSMLDALGLERITNSVYSPKNKIVVLEIAETVQLAALEPDFNALVQSYENINGVLVTAASKQDGYDFYYRYFWPWAGTNEDPVTGGVQTFLTKYWSDRLGKKRMNAFQCSERTGFMTVEWRADKVFLFGEAVIVFEGVLRNIN